MKAALCATDCAAICGVVTTSISESGRNPAKDIAVSPVPGGKSISKKSGSSQATSVRNWLSAL